MGLRIGSGIDVHAFGGDGPVMLGTLAIDHPRGLAGHSDSDVAAHALCDALLAAAGAPDIGHFFPPGDPEWAGASGARLLGLVMEELGRRDTRVVNAHVTIVCESPRIGPVRAEMETALTALLSAPVTVHATTTEGLGFAGREEGIMSQAVALVEQGET